jgi:uroporphyrinogen III methyltransferase / synthase
MNSGRVVLVGAGPGDPGLLTLRAAQVLAHADVLLYDALASDPIVALVPPSCERIYVGKRAGEHALLQEEIEALMIARARRGGIVVRLKGGDPFIFGRGGEEATALREAGVAFEIVPGISSAVAAPAYAGIPLTHRDRSSAVTIATGHEDPVALAQGQRETRLDWSKLFDPNGTLVLLMAMGNLAAICERLAHNGVAADTPVAVIQDGTRPTQRTVTGTLATIAAAAEREGLAAPAIVVLGEVVRLREDLRWYDRRPLFGKRLLITRPAQQAQTFARAIYARGIEPILASTIAIVPPDDPEPARRAIDALAAYRWLVFTSQNGVDLFFDRLAALDCDARYVGATKIAAIGAKTAHRLRECGIRPDLVPPAFIGEEIARALIEASHEGDRILVYRAQDARDVLPQMLEDADRKPHVVAAYKTVFAIDPLLGEKTARSDILTFTSSSTVRGFAAALGGDDAASKATHGKLVACIGPIAAQTARDVGLHVDVIADVYTADGLLDALETHAALHA